MPEIDGFKPGNIGSLDDFSTNSATIADQKVFLNSALFLPNASCSWIQTGNIGSLDNFSTNSTTIADQKVFLNSALFLPNARDSWIQTREDRIIR
jgi:hypothetical protein